MALCPFKKSTYVPPPPPPPPLEGMLSVMDYGAHGDGLTDDLDHIWDCIDAAVAADKGVYFPAGTYLISSTISIPTGDSSYNGLLFRGATMATSKIKMATKAANTYMLVANNLDSFHVWDLTFTTTAVTYPSYVMGIAATGMQNSSVKRVRIENCDYGFKMGSGNQAYNWVVEDFETSNIGCLSLQPINISNSTFTRLTLDNQMDTGVGMCIYVERECHYLTFTDVTCTGGSRNCIQLYNGYGTNPSDHIYFTNTILDNRGSPKYPLMVDEMFSDCTFTDTICYGNAVDEPCIKLWGNRIVFNGLQATSGSMMISGTCVDCSIDGTRNGALSAPWGTYDGSTYGTQIGTATGCTITRMTRV